VAKSGENTDQARDPAVLGAGWLLAQARREAGITQAELARRLGISQPAVAQLERNRSNPRIETLERALSAVGLELLLDTRPLARAGRSDASKPARGAPHGERGGS
jgi:transcriptional regulator with XRE-family HTH domain